MPAQLHLQCRCGHVQGRATEVSPEAVNRLVCYCDDCQAFARFLEREDIMDAAGGTDIFQMAPGRLQITAGAEALRCVRLAPRGLIRWYTECCHTPVGNTVNARMPLVGVPAVFARPRAEGQTLDDVIGAPTGRCFGRFAVGGLPADTHPGVPARMVLRVLRLLARWWRKGMGRPSPFFAADTRAPRVEPRVLSAAERAALGPR